MILLNRFKKIYKKYERILIPVMLIIGVAMDFITFRAINIETAFIILTFYWILTALTMAFLYHQQHNKITNTIAKYYKVFAPLIIQYTFGALLSASFIFYWFSGSLSISWPFMLLIAFLMVANEAFREYYMRPTVQISVFYFITFSILSLMFPYLFNSISIWIFILSGITSMVIFYIYLHFLTLKFPHINYKKKIIRITILIIFLIMNILYFTNLIPPIPLSLNYGGVYHNVEKSGNNYILLSEKQNILERITPFSTIHLPTENNNSIYVFSSIFAPFNFNTTIVHEWQYFDSSKKRWITSDKLSFQIYGGRDNGYRGYSRKSTLSEGLWRVNVQTIRGQTIGRIKFKILYTEKEINNVEIIIN